MSQSMIVRKRLTLNCWSCQRDYEFTLSIEADASRPRLIVACPYCEEEGVVDLLPYRRDESVTVYRSHDAEATDLGELYDLPDVLPTAENQ